MIYTSEADIVPFFRSLTESLQPYAQTNNVHLSFSSRIKKQVVHYQPLLLSQSVIQLICNVISLLPSGGKIKVRLNYSPDKKNLCADIENSRINLIRVNEICAQTIYTFKGYPSSGGTLYRLHLPLNPEVLNLNNFVHSDTSNNNFPRFYSEIQKRLRSHFTQADKLLATLEQTRPTEAAFIQKINNIIRANLEDENFDTLSLCKAVCLSRTQLFRRLKSLIRQAPADYIRMLRLQKAKELLETTDLTISEIVFKCGFQTVSHFARIFKKKHGIQPSVFRLTNKNATNG